MAAPPEPIRFLNRHSGRIEEEAVYGERWLRWLYGTPSGRAAAWLVAQRAFFSRWYGWRMNRPRSRSKIRPFIDNYQLDVSEFARVPDGFASFNEFFFRELKPGVRSIDPDPRHSVFPADGRHLGFPNLSASESFFIKGQRFDLGRFLRDSELLRRFEGGPAVFSRLCPVDYHRFHFPVGGLPSAPRLVNGPLWSVSPIALGRNLSLLWRNRRWLTSIRSDAFGTVLMAEIGATNVGSTQYTFTSGTPVLKGSEKGFFRFGASAVLTLFEPGRVQLAPDLLEASSRPMELYARVGSWMAERVD